MNISRRNALILTAAATSAASLGAVTAPLAAEGDMYDVDALLNPDGWVDRAILGAEDAKATLIEYSSPTCPHCGQFHRETLPELETQYIETGKTRFILRPFIRNVLDAVVFMLADAAGEDSYHEVISTYFDSQDVWARSQTPRDAMLAVAVQLGFTEETFKSALTNQDLFTRMEKVRDQALNEFDLTGTPTFYVNGKMLEGDKTIEQLAAEIDPLQG
ncbi:MAG TPA: DsbA family protein [Devosia sp.]|nr:DsbA family protein [Devosia sp.]